MSKDKEPVYCVVKASSRGASAFLSIILAIGGAVTATYALKYVATRLSKADEVSPPVGYKEDI